jgi:hypothetical protein
MFPKIAFLATLSAPAPCGAHAECLLTAVAGSTGGGFPAAANGGLATAAPFYGVQGVAVDSSGNVYLADYNDNVVFRFSAAESLNIIAGTSSGIGLLFPAMVGGGSEHSVDEGK